jgi:hypothetical protein
MYKLQLGNVWILTLTGEATSRSASPCLTITRWNLAHDTLMVSMARMEAKSGGFNASLTAIRLKDSLRTVVVEWAERGKDGGPVRQQGSNVPPSLKSRPKRKAR